MAGSWCCGGVLGWSRHIPALRLQVGGCERDETWLNGLVVAYWKDSAACMVSTEDNIWGDSLLAALLVRDE
jgi:hypothetical protein